MKQKIPEFDRQKCLSCRRGFQYGGRCFALVDTYNRQEYLEDCHFIRYKYKYTGGDNDTE